MIPTTRIALALVLLAGASTYTLAQNMKLRPGLWEVQSTMTTSSGRMESAMAQMQEQLEKMPPEQRRLMEQMMAGRGVAPSDKGVGSSFKICMTQKDVDMDNVQPREGCTHKTSRSGANTMHISFQCKGRNGEPPSSGEGTITIDGPTAYSGQHKINTTADGKPEEMNLTQKGRWLSADCGTVKPREGE